MLHLFPLHPDAQEHVLGPTHLPLFMHIGSHTPGTHLFTHYHILPVALFYMRLPSAVLLTLLTPFSCVAFRAGAYIVPHTLTSILTRGTAYS